MPGWACPYSYGDRTESRELRVGRERGIVRVHVGDRSTCKFASAQGRNSAAVGPLILSSTRNDMEEASSTVDDDAVRMDGKEVDSYQT